MRTSHHKGRTSRAIGLKCCMLYAGGSPPPLHFMRSGRQVFPSVHSAPHFQFPSCGLPHCTAPHVYSRLPAAQHRGLHHTTWWGNAAKAVRWSGSPKTLTVAAVARAIGAAVAGWKSGAYKLTHCGSDAGHKLQIGQLCFSIKV